MKLLQKYFLKFLVVLGVCLSFASTLTADFDPSFQISVRQRFFKDPRLGKVNGFSEWGALLFDTSFGIYEFKSGLEIISGFSIITNSAELFAEDANGNWIYRNGQPIETEDRLEYQIYGFSLGARYPFWNPNFLRFVPYAEASMVYRYGRVHKKTYAVGQQKTSNGGDLGFDLGGGLFVSLMVDPQRKSELESEWDLRDFGLVFSSRYNWAGFARHGLGLVSSLGGWDFGGGLYLKW